MLSVSGSGLFKLDQEAEGFDDVVRTSVSDRLTRRH